MSSALQAQAPSVPSQTEINRWRTTGEYLPAFMRDFHDQKDLFKAMQEVVERANAKNGAHRSLEGSWTDYHIYTVDIFLWVMAGHGYTLQRTRKRMVFNDIYAFVGESQRRAAAAFASLWASRATPPLSDRTGGEK